MPVPAGVRLRRGRPDEAVVLADLWLAARAAAAPAVPPPAHTDDQVRAWWRDVVLPAGEVWVADASADATADATADDAAADTAGRPVGVAVVEGTWLEQLYVLGPWTGAGVGAALLERARKGRNLLELWTFEANSGARRFYERHGFVAVARTDGDNEEGAPDVRYRWERRGAEGPERSERGGE